MRIATLQFSPILGDIEANISRANAIFSASPLHNIDLLVLPELAFTGYNHTLASILPLLEPAGTGRSTLWALSTAAKYNCLVSVGYPELVPARQRDVEPSSIHDEGVGVEAYNSTVTVSPKGHIVAHYRKTHLYYTDEPWAREGPAKWLIRDLPLPHHSGADTTKAAFGICMDLNPYRFSAPWDAYEFSTSALNARAEILLLSMAWLTSLPAVDLAQSPAEPDMETFAYWLNRLTPLLEGESDVLVVCANRCGEEGGKNPAGEVEGVRYAGSSWIGRVGRGKVDVWGMLGRVEEGLCMADTELEPGKTFRLVGKEEREYGIPFGG